MNFIEYVKQIWKNGPGGGTPWSAARLNHMEDGIKNNNSMISELNNNITFYSCFTKNFISESNCEGYGYNFAIYNKTAKVGILKFTTKIERASSDTSDFKFRYDINKVFNLFNLQISDAIKILGGTWQCYNAEGKIINKLIGYGTCIDQTNKMIRLARYYNTDGYLGAWAASEFVKGYYIYGEFVFLQKY